MLLIIFAEKSTNICFAFLLVVCFLVCLFVFWGGLCFLERIACVFVYLFVCLFCFGFFASNVTLCIMRLHIYIRKKLERYFILARKATSYCYITSGGVIFGKTSFLCIMWHLSPPPFFFSDKIDVSTYSVTSYIIRPLTLYEKKLERVFHVHGWLMYNATK